MIEPPNGFREPFDLPEPSRAKIEEIKRCCSNDFDMRQLIILFGTKGTSRVVTVEEVEGVILTNQRSDAVRLLKLLALREWGAFFYGRKKHKSRFECLWQLQYVHWLITRAETIQPAASDLARPARVPELVVAGAPESSITMIEHMFHLRPNLTIKLNLPADMAPSEAARVSTFVQSLPFSI